ncbi:hypothetical protein [Burkholderia pseudomallei]|uniref:hypothetical protein n=1 Tax=Burkholderia pseudomallei TaxID=28450 RepID=UPI0006A5AA06|nr:hypothetical protein [Burkholderia pseudomallei]
MNDQQQSRADALTDAQIRSFAENACDHEVGAGALRQNVATVGNVILAIRNALKLAAAPPVEQPAAVPADEPAAFDLTDIEWLNVFERVSATIPNVFGGYMKVRAAFAREAIRLADEARAAASPAVEAVAFEVTEEIERTQGGES